MQGVGNQIKTRRKELGLTQEQLAEISGIAQSEISRIEKQRIKNIEVERLRTLAKSLRISADWLLELESVS
jgi:XRE family aerobic/anaerobic benzoate catabolism transcriptional regulator